MAVNRKNLCPNCGAKLTGLEIKCPECGYVLTQESGMGQSTTESLQELQDKLLAVDKVFNLGKSSSKKKASIINAFPIPQTLGALIRLLHMSYSNFEAAKEAGDKQLAMAWLGKAMESYRRLSEYSHDDSVTDTLKQYKVLGDKKAFAKLSGSYSRKKIGLFISMFLVALVVAFVLLFDWTGYFLKKGRVEEVVRHFTNKGKTEELLERLVNLDLFEEASDVMASNGQVIEAVSMLAQKGYTLPALILTAKTNNADTIHQCVHEIEKYCSLFGREEWHIDDNYCINRGAAELCVSIVYNHNRAMLQARLDGTNLDKTIWSDVWNINNSFYIPNQHYFLDSPFQSFYRTFHFDYDGAYYPDIRFNKQGKVVMITLDQKADLRVDFVKNKPFTSYPLQYFFYYNAYGVLLKEKVALKGVSICEVSYEYVDFGGEDIKSIKHYYDEDAIKNLYVKNNGIVDELKALNLYRRSYMDYYQYENGRLVCIETKDNSDKAYKSVFQYYDNIRICEDIIIDHTTNEETIKPEKSVEIFADGKIVEFFSVAMDL